MATTTQIVKFITGMEQFPPGRKPKIKVFFLPEDKVLPEAQTCFSYLYIPKSKSMEEFFEYFDKAVVMSLSYFGQA